MSISLVLMRVVVSSVGVHAVLLQSGRTEAAE